MISPLFFFLTLSVIATVSSSDGRETPASLSHRGYDGNNSGQWAHYDPGYWGPEAWWGCYPPSTPNILENSEQYWDPYLAMYAYMAEMNAAYGFAPIPYPSMYSSHHFASPRPVSYQHGNISDSDECSGYSSTDEMAYFGRNFVRGSVPVMNSQYGSPMVIHGMPPPPSAMPSIVTRQTPGTDGSQGKVNAYGSRSSEKADNANNKVVKIEVVNSPKNEVSVPRPPSSVDLDAYETAESEKCSDEEEAAADSDTEVEEDNKDGLVSGQQQAVCVVSDNLYMNVQDPEDENDDDDDDEEEGEEKKHCTEGEECIPHQLSIIYEESEQSDAESVLLHSGRATGRCPTGTSSSLTTSEDGDSSTTLDNGDDDSDGDFDVLDSESSTVTVRLPLKLKFSRSENDEEVTTVIVGDSQVKRQETVDMATPPVTELKDKKPKQEDEEAPKEEQGGGDCTDISVTLCFPSSPDLSDRVEEWRRDTSQYAGNNLINMNNDNIVSCTNSLSTKSGKGTRKPGSKMGSEAPQQAALDEADVYETAESDSDVSVCLSLPLRKRSQRGLALESVSNISEEDDEEDGKASSHCEDDSSSTTSIQTVRITSGSRGRSSGSEIETAATDEGDESTVNKLDSSTEISIPECALENNMKSPATQDQSSESESDDDDDDDVEEEESSGSGKTSTSNRSCINNKEVLSKKGKKNSLTLLLNEDMAIEKKKDNEDDESEKSDDSQDAEEHDIIQKIYDLCTESEKVFLKDVKQRNVVTSKEKDVGFNKDQGGADTAQKLLRHEKEQQSCKLQEESEEDDSGVTSDMSRPISDADTESEAGRGEQGRLMKCQRASTHSRLFKLLQDECGKSDDEEEEGAVMKPRRENLTLPLRSTNGSDPDSLSSSSGVTSPASPTITDRLVKELVQNLLQRKRGRRLKKLPLAKLHAASLRILQEDMDPYDTGSSEDSPGNHAYLMPTQRQGPYHSSNTASYPIPPQQVMYGDNYHEYCDYYDSWANASSYYGNDACSGFEHDIMPSRAFKLLSEHSQPGGFSSGIINGLWAKCPRIMSSRNMPKLLTDDTDKVDSGSSSCPAPPPPSAPASARAT